MPFSKTNDKHNEVYWTTFFEKFIKPSVEKFGYTCNRSKAEPSNIIKDILTELVKADLVLAVLTDFNANVWYELGNRHALRRGTIMIIEDGQNLPFDISQYGVIKYEDSISNASEFEEKLQTFISRIEKTKDADSPALEFLSEEKEDNYLQRIEDIEIDYKTKITKIANLVHNIQIEGSEKDQKNETKKKIPNHVLWVDDCPTNNEAIIEIYGAQGVEFDVALNTSQAINLLSQKEYNLVISDLKRGQENDAGIRMIREIKRQFGIHPPVIIFDNIQISDMYESLAKSEGAILITASVRTLFMKMSEILII